jgi:hypothetical protein
MSPGLPISPTSPSQIKFNRWRSIPLAVADETNINTSAVVESPSSSASVAAAVSTSAVTASKPVWTPPVYGPEHEQAARVIQDAWRAYRHRRAEAAVVIQRAWRNFKGIPNPSFSQSSDLPVLLQPSVTSVSFQFGLPNAPRMSPSHSVDGSMEFSPIAARSPKPSRRMSIPMLISEHIKRNRTVSAASLKKHMMANSQQSDQVTCFFIEKSLFVGFPTSFCHFFGVQNADNTSGSVDNALRSMGAFHDNYLNIAPLPPAFPGTFLIFFSPFIFLKAFSSIHLVSLAYRCCWTHPTAIPTEQQLWCDDSRAFAHSGQLDICGQCCY